MEFRFQHFTLAHDRSTMKIGTDAVLLATLTDIGQARSLLDIGTGCGVVAFCMAQRMQAWGDQARICGVDPDEPSILEARANAATFRLLPESCFHFEHTSIQNFVLPADMPKFDLVVSNPPFYNPDLKPSRENRLKSRHRDGQLPFEALVDSVVRLLARDGKFSIILPPVESDEFRDVAAGKLYCHKTITVRPTARKPVYRHVREYSLSPVRMEEPSLLTIRDENGHYTSDYLALTRDFLRLSSL
ncbi:MAG: methyltransferase [Bacteroidales bacterium]|nr:methyltransferase [Bacteroidales bacterium]